jgi:DNA-binding Lrp family transcriptional regulator
VENVVKKMVINWIWGQQLYCIDEVDFKILQELANNARISTKHIANNLNSTVNTISNRIKKLEKELIIALYSINIDWSKLGYRWFHLQISLRDYRKKNQIIQYMRNNPYLIRRFKFLNLDMDLHFTLLLKNMQQLRDIIEGISTTFPDAINDYHFYSTFKVYKYHFMVPEILKNKDPINRGHTF